MVESDPILFRCSEDPLDLHALMRSLITPETVIACVLMGSISMPNIARDETVAGQVKKAGLPRLADVEVQRVAEEIRMRWPNVTRIGIAQRIGPLEPGMQVLMVACTSDEYDEGLWEAAQLGMNRLGPGLCLGQRANASEGSGIEHSMPDVEDGERT